MTRARSNLDELERDLAENLRKLRKMLDVQLVDGSDADIALNSVETFCVVAMRVMRKTNPSKIHSEARTVEIKARMDGIPVIRGAA
jgi:transcriptional regulator